jgi:ribonuclease BN (tRNA processing enzyme)
MDIRILGAHNCESADTKLPSLLIDDCLALDAGGLTSSVSFADQLKLRALLLSHMHYDHIRDIPALAMNFYLRRSTLDVFSIRSVRDALTTYLLDGKLYPNFLERPTEKPTLRFITLEPLQTTQIARYKVIGVPVSHAVPAVGYQVTDADGKTIFYTGDAGPGLAECWQWVSPQLLITEVTLPNHYYQLALESGHLTPELLRQELVAFKQLKGFLPEVVTVHMSPEMETKIVAEVAAVAQELGVSIAIGREGMELHL